MKPQLRKVSPKDYAAHLTALGVDTLEYAVQLFPLTGMWQRFDLPAYDNDTILNELRLAEKGYELLGRLLRTLRMSMPSDVVALSVHEPSHFYLEEFGVTLTEDKPYPAWAVEAAYHYMVYHAIRTRRQKLVQSNLGDYHHVRASFPRGKNTGLPIMTSGTNRAVNDIIMIINARLARAAIEGYRFPESLLEAYFVFDRLQFTAKEVPMRVGTQILWSQNFEPRRRIVNATVKPYAMALKPFVKFHTELALASPYGEQDRTALRYRINRCHYASASDQSRFDLRHGGVKLRQAIDVLLRVARATFPSMPDLSSLALLEAELPALAPWRRPTEAQGHMFLLAAPYLRSGSALTSRAGTTMSLISQMATFGEVWDVRDPVTLAKRFVDREPVVILSDDVLNLFESADEASAFYKVRTVLDPLYGEKVEEESPVKFLGYYINGGQAGPARETIPELDLDLPRIIARMYFPERIRNFLDISIWSKIQLVAQGDAASIIKPLTGSQRILANTLLRHFAQWHAIHPKMSRQKIPADFDALDMQVRRKLQNAVNTQQLYDDILHIIAKGSEFDFNFSLVGLPELDEIASTQGVQLSLQDDLEQWLRNIGDNTVYKTRTLQGQVVPMVQMVTDAIEVINSPDSLVFERAYEFGRRYGREVSTTKGSFFIM